MPGSAASKKQPTSPSVKPAIAVTIGDAAGIGPEIIVKSLDQWDYHRHCLPLVIGPAALLDKWARRLKSRIRFEAIYSFNCWKKPSTRTVYCYFPERFPDSIETGRIDVNLSRLAVRAVEIAAGLALKKLVAAIVTAPINKAGVQMAGFDIPGHTEYLAALSSTRQYEMMLVGGPLRVVPVTRHIAIKDVPHKITAKRLLDAMRLVDTQMRQLFGIAHPRMAVSALNPHAGEQGKMGDEEIRIIEPAIRRARTLTKSVITGPVSPDALFRQAYHGLYDVVLCMYHDQGLIPLKMIARDSGVNVTLGLPFVRTSPDHGTGYDIAGKAIAHPGSMIEALKLAVELSQNSRR
ncbi:MAG: 4-hydroxythreonine-4-phosphate dehydrogenase PdxA [Candidatus Omnitrophota bacterium]